MRFMCFIKHEEKIRSMTLPDGLMEAMGTFVSEGMRSGTIVDTAGLKGTAHASTITQHKRKLTVSDGPFAESKEIVGGYALLELPTRDEAMVFARQFMELHCTHWPEFEGSCEVRPLEDM